ncbi:DUF202 domain-containing protein [Aeromicrobium sp. Sec7.5]|uniref:DUF202 domain-containing protein n=1 Tax=Aeromicrobium sp. Sec7.5 TaxID=3121276 RepID=UPI002FE4A334
MSASVWDPGLQNERTTLAWGRSALALLVCGLLTATLAASRHWFPAVVVALVAMGSAAGLRRVARHRYLDASSALVAERPLPDGRLGAALVLGVVGLGALAVTLVVVTSTGAIRAR